MHTTVIYHCSNCGHGWKRERHKELDKDIPPLDEDVCIHYDTCAGRVRECAIGSYHDDCFENVDGKHG